MTVTFIDYEFAPFVILPTAELQRACRVLRPWGDRLEISITKSALSFSVKDSHGTGSVTLYSNSREDDSQIKIETSKEVTLPFLLYRLFPKLIALVSLSSLVKLSLDVDTPVAFELRVSEFCKVCCYEAPFVE